MIPLNKAMISWDKEGHVKPYEHPLTCPEDLTFTKGAHFSDYQFLSEREQIKYWIASAFVLIEQYDVPFQAIFDAFMQIEKLRDYMENIFDVHQRIDCIL